MKVLMRLFAHFSALNSRRHAILISGIPAVKAMALHKGSAMLPVLPSARESQRYSNLPANRQRWLRELCVLLAFPTVSAHPHRRPAIDAAARWLESHMRYIGLHNAQVLPGI